MRIFNGRPLWFSGGCLIPGSLPFMAIGLLMTVYFYRDYQLAQRTASWLRVPARIESVELKNPGNADGHASWRELKAAYSYEYAGQVHQGSRLTPNDHVHPPPEELERQHAVLLSHQQTGEPLTALVNPDDPGESLLFPAVRKDSWAMLVFGLAVAFMALTGMVAGVREMVFGWRRAHPREARTQSPWREDRRWAAGFVFPSPEGADLTRIWGTSLFIAALVAPLIILAALTDGSPVFRRVFAGFCALMWLPFPVLAVYFTFRYRKYGSPRLVLNEMPVVPGRSMAAALLLDRRLDARGPITFTLHCRHLPRFDEDDCAEKLYKGVVEVAPERESTGTVRFEMPIPAGLPSTTPRGREPAVKWTLQVTADAPGVDFLVNFDLPVFNVADESLIEKRPEGTQP
ncbi:MAG TPA: DUF3592 domain-containing protein [Planctomycetota bacterium]|nr:DUF3592 domain-containing protein [Planctomycetota bacterium]